MPLHLVDQEAVEHAVRPRRLELTAQAVGHGGAGHPQFGHRSGNDAVEQVDPAVSRVGARGAHPRLQPAALVVPLFDPVDVVLPVAEVEAVARRDPQPATQRHLVGAGAVDAHLGDLGPHPARRRRDLGPAEADLVADGDGAVGVVARDGPQLHAAQRPIADHRRQPAAGPQVLRQDHLDVGAQPLGQREPRRRVDVLGDEPGILAHQVGVEAAFDAQAVEADGPAGHAEQLAREQRQRVLAAERVAAEQDAHHRLIGVGVARRHVGLEPVERARDGQRRVVSARARRHRDVEVRLDRRRVGERDAALVQLIETAEDEHLAALAQLGPAGEARPRDGPLQPQVGAGLEASVVVVDEQVVLGRHRHVEPHGVEVGRLLRRDRGPVERDQRRQADGGAIGAAQHPDVAAQQRSAGAGHEYQQRVDFAVDVGRVLDRHAARLERQLAADDSDAGEGEGAAGVEGPAVQRAAEPRHHHPVAVEEDRSGDVRGDHPWVADHRFDRLEIDAAVDPRRRGRAGDPQVERGDAVHRQLRREHRQRPQPRCSGQRDIERGDVAEGDAAADDHRLAGAERHVVEAEDALGDRQTGRVGLADRHARRGDRGLVEHQRARDAVDVGAGQIERQRRRDPRIEAAQHLRRQPRPQRVVSEPAHGQIDAPWRRRPAGRCHQQAARDPRRARDAAALPGGLQALHDDGRAIERGVDLEAFEGRHLGRGDAAVADGGGGVGVVEAAGALPPGVQLARRIDAGADAERPGHGDEVAHRTAVPDRQRRANRIAQPARRGEQAGPDVEVQIVEAEVVGARGDVRRPLQPQRNPRGGDRHLLQVHERAQ